MAELILESNQSPKDFLMYHDIVSGDHIAFTKFYRTFSQHWKLSEENSKVIFQYLHSLNMERAREEQSLNLGYSETLSPPKKQVLTSSPIERRITSTGRMHGNVIAGYDLLLYLNKYTETMSKAQAEEKRRNALQHIHALQSGYNQINIINALQNTLQFNPDLTIPQTQIQNALLHAGVKSQSARDSILFIIGNHQGNIYMTQIQNFFKYHSRQRSVNSLLFNS
jgi:hypothetical protein